jgi:serine/threonine protein kinase
MSSEVSATRFVELIGRSGLVPADRLPTILGELGYDASSPAWTAPVLADRLVARGILTHFQASKLLKGRWIGLVVGPYRILSPLGRGGMGLVFLAQDQRRIPDVAWSGEGGGMQTPWESLVALKILPPRLARTEPRMRERFEREQRYYHRVSHPRVVRMQDAGQWQEIRYIALEFVPGRSLQEMVGRWGRLEPQQAIPLFADVAEGLQHLHDQRLIHRDVKPANIMVTPQGTAKILDLGLAMATDEPPPHDVRIAGGKGYIVGTMDYIAPEQARHATAIDHRADLYALGCTLYFALTGTPPFPGGSKRDKIRWQRQAEPIFIRDLNPAVPPALADLTHRLMAKRPQHRPASAWQVREELLAITLTPSATTTLPAWSAQETVEMFDTDTAGTDWWEEGNEQSADSLLQSAGRPSPQEGIVTDSQRPPPLPPKRLAMSPWLVMLLICVGFVSLAAILLVLRQL